MDGEYGALIKPETWSLVPVPPQDHIIGLHWIYKTKRHYDGFIAHYKARLVAAGNQQAERLDFTETFSPVVKQLTISVVLSIALHYGWPLRQLDVNKSFLNGFLDEDVYMR